MRQIVLDTETTGMRVEDGHKIIEIGCLELINRKLTKREFHVYLNPLRDVDAGALAVHGISNEFLIDKPTFDVIADDFIAFIEGSELIIHNAPFDVGFLNYELSLLGKKYRSIADYCSVIDSLTLARQLHVGQRNSLDALCKRYGVDNSKREYHGALMDAFLLAQVYLAMTGGQGSFFDTLSDMETASTQEQQMNDDHAAIAQDICVITATQDDKAAHQRYLDMLEQQGKCLWRDNH